MKSAPTGTLTENLLYNQIGGAICRPKIKTQYYDTINSTWTSFEDLESRNINLSIENKRYQAYSFLPPVKTIDFTLNNFGQIYSTGSGDPKASILKKNLLVRAYTGYQLTAGVTKTDSDDFISNNSFYKTIKSGSTVILDSTNTTESYDPNCELGLSLYGSAIYGSGTYTYSGYYKNTFLLTNEQEPKELNITVSSNKFDIKYKIDIDAWSSYSSLSTGSNNFILDCDNTNNEINTIIRFRTDTYSTAHYISDLNVVYDDETIYFKRGTFVIDEPVYSDRVKVTGRDYLKKALETEINLPDYTSTTSLSSIVTNILDRCNVPYDTSTWDTISTATKITSSSVQESLNNISGWQALDFAMDVVNAGSENIVFRFNDDGKAELKKIPTSEEADWTTHYKYNIESISKNFDSDSQLQRITAVNKDIVVNAESLLKNIHGTIGTASNVTATYSNAIYVRYEDSLNKILSETARENNSVSLSLTAGHYDIDVYGCTPKNSISDEIWAELGNSDNIKNNNGSTFKKVNPMFNQITAEAYCDYMISINSDPKKSITLTQTPNPLTELGIDKWLVFDKYTYTNNLYIPQQISESWSNPTLKETVTLKDSGFLFDNFIWDRNGFLEGNDDLKYDVGLVWDMDLGSNSLGDTATYTKITRY